MEMNPQDDDQPATKGFVRTAIQETQEMIKGVETKLAIKIVQLEAKTEQMIGRLREEVRAGFREQKGQIDSFIARIEGYARETVMLPKTIDEHATARRPRRPPARARIVAGCAGTGNGA